ncbi:hypothetical protein GCM10025762_54180 [Haloechinothrix salitolerans]
MDVTHGVRNAGHSVENAGHSVLSVGHDIERRGGTHTIGLLSSSRIDKFGGPKFSLRREE